MKPVLEIIGGKKECEWCGHFLGVEQFYPSTSQKGLVYYSRKCRKCTREYLLQKTGEKHCPKCDETKSFQQFRPNKESYDRYCKSCRNEINNEKYKTDAAWRKAHNDAVSRSCKKHRIKCTARLNRWKERNPDKVLKTRLAYIGKHKVNNKKWVDANKERVLTKNREWLRKIKRDLDDKYIKYYLRSSMGIKEIPPTLIKLKKLQILAKRTIKLKHNEPHRAT